MRTFKTIAVGSLAALALTMSAIPAQAMTGAGPSSRQIAPQTPDACLYYLNTVGYPTTTERAQGCNHGSFSFNTCVDWLVSRAGVSVSHAQRACYLAYF